MIVSTATPADLSLIARCHMEAFPQSLTTKFGHAFVTKMLEWYLSGDNKFLFWIAEDNVCIGYCGGHVMNGTDAYGAGSGMTQFGFNAAALAFVKQPWLLFHPEVLKKYGFIARNIKHRVKKILGIAEKNPISKMLKINGQWDAGLVVIGVLPSHQGLGIGKILLAEFDKRALALGAYSVSLSVRKNNSNALQAYRKYGYAVDEESETSYIMRKRLKT